MRKNNKVWNNMLRKTIKLYPKSSVKSILLKTKKKLRRFQRTTKKR